MLTNDLTTILVAVALWVMAGLLGLLHHARRTGKELPDDWAPWMGAAMLGPLTPVLAAYGRAKRRRFRQATLADEAFASVRPDTPQVRAEPVQEEVVHAEEPEAEAQQLRQLSKRELAEMVLRARRQGKQVRLSPVAKCDCDGPERGWPHHPECALNKVTLL